jgi:hypothetical protein
MKPVELDHKEMIKALETMINLETLIYIEHRVLVRYTNRLMPIDQCATEHVAETPAAQSFVFHSMVGPIEEWIFHSWAVFGCDVIGLRLLFTLYFSENVILLDLAVRF